MTRWIWWHRDREGMRVVVSVGQYVLKVDLNRCGTPFVRISRLYGGLIGDPDLLTPADMRALGVFSKKMFWKMLKEDGAFSPVLRTVGQKKLSDLLSDAKGAT